MSTNHRVAPGISKRRVLLLGRRSPARAKIISVHSASPAKPLGTT